MWRQAPAAAGYLSIFVVPLLLVVGAWIDVPGLSFGVVMLVFPLLRTIVGPLTQHGTIWHESLATALDRLPVIYALTMPVAIAVVLRQPHQAESLPEAIGLGLSLWVTLLLSTCVSHELIHRRAAVDALIGHCLAGMAGYPVLAQEHLAHHARPGNTRSADWPRVDESVWAFACRRARRIVAETYAPGSAVWNVHAGGRSVLGLRLGCVAFAATAIAFVNAGGWTGLALYLCVVAGVWFGVQLVTYLQHWGLGNDRLGARALDGYGWEDDCRFQSWVTLGVSLHHAHHRQSGLPFYRLIITPDSPRLPAGYIVLMVLCLFPGLWFRAMRPALEHWERHPADPRSPGRKITCFSAYTASESPVSRRYQR